MENDTILFGTLGSIIVLVLKPHQETVSNINTFIWRLCVSHCAFNAVATTFAFPYSLFPENFGDSNGEIFYIKLDTPQGCYQI